MWRGMGIGATGDGWEEAKMVGETIVYSKTNTGVKKRWGKERKWMRSVENGGAAG